MSEPADEAETTPEKVRIHAVEAVVDADAAAVFHRRIAEAIAIRPEVACVFESLKDEEE